MGDTIVADNTGGFNITGKSISQLGGVTIDYSNNCCHFAARLSDTGGAIVARAFPGRESVTTYLAIDDVEDIYVAGTLYGSADLGGGVLTSAGDADIYIAKYTGGFSHVWSRRLGSTGADSPAGIVVDGSGNILLAGSFSGTVDFGPATLTSVDGSDIFVIKLSGGGGGLWGKRFGGCGSESAADIEVDAAGKVAVVGSVARAVDFGGGALRVRNGGGAFAVKLSPTGDHIWSRTFSGANTVSVAMDSAGAVMMSGTFFGSISFGGPALMSAGASDAFVVKFAP
jgi:hypothetical protein